MTKNYSKHYKIQKLGQNNVNWMNILRLAFKLDPKMPLMKNYHDDKKISILLNKLSK